MHEIAKHFDCTAAAVCHAPKQMRMARKKDRHLQRTRPGK
ncbi:transposase [Neisseria gonorrhoeae]|nr:transposase [Neisseria gonorrhoeae]